MTEELEKKEKVESLEGKEDKAISGEIVQSAPQPHQPQQQQQYLPSSQSFFFRPLSESGFPTWSVYVIGCVGIDLHS